jgi:hypothetical protein
MQINLPYNVAAQIIITELYVLNKSLVSHSITTVRNAVEITKFLMSVFLAHINFIYTLCSES